MGSAVVGSCAWSSEFFSLPKAAGKSESKKEPIRQTKWLILEPASGLVRGT